MRAFAFLAVALMLSGCLVGQRSSAPDADTDGLPDEVETGGWNVTIIRTQFACPDDTPLHVDVEERHVTSNPLRTDTDGDGVTDFQEFYFHGDPNSTDTDGDGLTDGEEWALRSDPSLFAPTVVALNKRDSDEDCLSDSDEVKGLVIPGLGLRTSDPTIPDTDHDGLTDAQEFLVTHTDPRNPDTDGDGAIDRLDADPLHDLWANITFTGLFVKQTPNGASNANVQVSWSIPAHGGGSFGHSRILPVHPNGAASLAPADMPGLFDLEDAAGGPKVQFTVSALFVDDAGRATGILDINPFAPRQTLTVKVDTSTGSWSFQKADGSFGPAGTAKSLDTDAARFQFDVDVLRGHP